MVQAEDMGPEPTDAAARRADLSDAAELARLRWRWRAVEGNEEGDPDRFTGDFTNWFREHIPGPARWTRRSGDLQSVYVMAGYRDRGLGHLLIGALVEEARHEGLAWLSVHPSPRSFPFYRRLGFTREGSLLYLDLAPARDDL